MDLNKNELIKTTKENIQEKIFKKISELNELNLNISDIKTVLTDLYLDEEDKEHNIVYYIFIELKESDVTLYSCNEFGHNKYYGKEIFEHIHLNLTHYEDIVDNFNKFTKKIEDNINKELEDYEILENLID